MIPKSTYGQKFEKIEGRSRARSRNFFKKSYKNSD